MIRPRNTLIAGEHRAIPWRVCLGNLSLHGYVQTRMSEARIKTLPIHGGITQELDGWIGFDTGHVGDYCDILDVARFKVPLSAGFIEFNQAEGLDQLRYPGPTDRTWTVADVATETRRLVELVFEIQSELIGAMR